MTKVADRSKIVSAMVEASERGRALLGGTTAMRLAGEKYLPKFQAEDPSDYKARLGQSWLFNGYRKTIRDMTGKVFDKPVELGDGADAQIIKYAENIDLQGRDLSAWGRDVFAAGLSDGITYIMVDAPPRVGDVTRAAAEAQNLRPYFVHLNVSDILGWKTVVIDNVTTLSMLRIMETVTEEDPKDRFNDIEVEQVRVLERTDSTVSTTIFRKGKDEWEQYGEVTYSGLADITVVPFYANRTGFFTGAPLLDDLADINIAHWQSQSDQRNILRVARVPILLATGFVEDDGAVVIGASEAIKTSNPDSRVSWVEHSGAAIGAGRQDLKDLEFQMETFGLQLLVARTGNAGATGAALDADKETSTLAATADAFKDALEQALRWAAAYGGVDAASISATVNKDYGAGTMTAQELTVLLTAVNTGKLSKVTFLRKLVEAGMIASDTDVDEEMERIEVEGEGLMTDVG